MVEIPMRPGPRFIIDHVVLFQMVSDAAFFAALPPACDDIQRFGHEVYDEAVQAALGRTCQGCSTLGQVMTPFATALGVRLTSVQEVAPALLEPLMAYISGKRGYRPDTVVMYYKVEGKAYTLTL